MHRLPSSHLVRLAALVFAWLLLSLGVAQAQKRVALVIGNSNYNQVARLPNPANDSRAMADALVRLDFVVTLQQDLGKAAMEQTLADFSDAAREADLAVVYYAGHGMEMNGKNYLIPTDAKLKSDNRVQFETVSLDHVMLAIEGAKALKLVLLDACRDNPFANSMKPTNATRSISRGLAKVETNPGMLVSYAAAAGTTALDGDGKHSPYTEALLAHIEQPGLELSLLFRKVADAVQAKTDGKQTPFEYGRLPGVSIYLKEPVLVEEKPVVAPVTVVNDPCRDAAAHWAAIENQNNPALFEDHLRQFGSCAFATVAQARLDTLRQPKAEPVIETKVESSVETQPVEIAALDPKVEEPAILAPDNNTANAAVPDEQPTQDNPAEDMVALTRGLQEELRRVGCAFGKADGIWGPQSQKALERFGRETKKSIDTETPSQASLDLLKSTTGKVCAPVCSVREELRNGVCVAKTCAAGQILSKKGQCIETKAKPTQTTKRRVVREDAEVSQARRRPVVVEEKVRPVRRHRATPSFNGSRDDCMTAFMCDN